MSSALPETGHGRPIYESTPQELAEGQLATHKSRSVIPLADVRCAPESDQTADAAVGPSSCQ
jgi:hypothetical protein